VVDTGLTSACASRPASPTRPPARSSPLRSRSGCWSATAGRPMTSPAPRCCATWAAPPRPSPTRSASGNGCEHEPRPANASPG
jgi:hypothetical protein